MNLNKASRDTPECEATKYFGSVPKDCINFSIGEPLFRPPASVTEAYVKAIRDGSNRYAPISGFPDLREKIAEKLSIENKIQAKGEEILVTNGATEAIGFVLLSTVDRGDEVVICEPNYPIYGPIVRYCGGKPVVLPLREENEFRIDAEELKGMTSERTRMVVINTPHNPTGMMLDKKTLKALSEICRADMLVDEVYEKITYEEEHHSLAALSGKPENVITVNSFSKSYCMCGYRIGYMHAQRDFINELLKLKLYISNCASVPAQRAALAALDDREFPESLRAEFEKNKNIFMKGMRRLGVPCVEPKGTFYAFPNVSEFGSDKEVYEKLLKAGVLTMPGSIFSSCHNEHVRFSFVCSPEDIKEGMERMERCLR